MAAIVPDDPWQCLMRKIGYSVGLEKLLERVGALTELYAAERRLSYASFQSLVETSYGRPGATEDFADFYQQLHLLQLARKTAYPLYTLDTLAILRRCLAEDAALFGSACRLVLLHAVLEADGDVFLNALAAGFDRMKFKAFAEDMINKKRQPMKQVGQSRAFLGKVYGIINIESQRFNRGNPRKESIEGQSRFAGRTESLDMAQRRTKPLDDQLHDSIRISDDVLKKIPRTRKAWAEDFGLFDKSGITEKGRKLLSVLDDDLNMRQDSGCYICWPYASDLTKIRIQPEHIGATRYTPWDLLVTIAKGTEDVAVKASEDEGDHSEAIALLKDFHRFYQEANIERGSIRLQLPLYIAQPCLVGLYSARREDIPPLPHIIDSEIKRDVRRLERVAIRETEGAITFPRVT